jgi:hypothetical protein
MEFVRFDAGEVLRMERGGFGPNILRLVVGNPLIMEEMAKTVPDAASYASITILVRCIQRIRRATGGRF